MLKKIICNALSFYKKNISPYLGENCRFYPSCSRYAHDAVMKKGVVLGMGLMLVRLIKCNPLHPGGIDQVE